MHPVVWLALSSLLVVSAAGQPFTLRSPDFRTGEERRWVTDEQPL
jgi:hypothetical protein